MYKYESVLKRGLCWFIIICVCLLTNMLAYVFIVCVSMFLTHTVIIYLYVCIGVSDKMIIAHAIYSYLCVYNYNSDL